MYRELHLSSSGRTGGDRTHPRWEMEDEIELSHFCLRSVQFPRSWFNVNTNQTLQFVLNGVPLKDFYLLIPKGSYSLVTFAAQVQAGLRAAVDATGTANPFTNHANITATLVAIGTRTFMQVNFQGGDVVYFRWPVNRETDLDAYRIFGAHHLNEDLIHEFKAATPNNVYPMLLYQNRYFFLRSNALTGSRFTGNVQVKEGSYNSGNIIAKIPLNTAEVGFDEYANYVINDSPSMMNMFKFDGIRLDKMDLYFTPAEMSEPVDFQELPWSVSLGILGPCH